MWTCGVCLKQVDDDRDPVSVSNDVNACSQRCRKIYHETVDNIEQAFNGQEMLR